MPFKLIAADANQSPHRPPMSEIIVEESGSGRKSRMVRCAVIDIIEQQLAVAHQCQRRMQRMGLAAPRARNCLTASSRPLGLLKTLPAQRQRLIGAEHHITWLAVAATGFPDLARANRLAAGAGFG